MKASKAIIAGCMAALCMASCTTVTKTAGSVDVANDIGLANVKAAAVAEALKQNGGADVLVDPQYETRTRRGLFGKKIKYVTVTGYPAKYKKFETATK